MSVTAAGGFVASGIHCGIKPSGDLDLSLVATVDGRPVPTAAVFTANRMTAAPVLMCQEHLAVSGGRAAATILNSGNANAATGDRGRDDARRMCAVTATSLGCAADQVLVCSTGLIGFYLPTDVILNGIPRLVIERSLSGGTAAAEAICTTDTSRKETIVRQGDVTVGGMAKGAAMLAPGMATMLAVLTTDANAEPHELQRALSAAVADSFNALVTDGCTSTNDTVILMASGAAGPTNPVDLFAAVAGACADLALQMADDAEGATKVVKLTVSGAASDADARVGARQVAGSALCKCSWYGEDPYWGRIASELGSAGIAFEQARVSVAYGGVVVAAAGIPVDHDAKAVAAHLAQRYIEVSADLGIGTGVSTVLTNDLTHAYIDENMATS